MKMSIVTAMLVAAASLVAAGNEVRPAPDVVLHASDGSAHRLAEFKGRVVLLDFWASWCAPCKASFPALDALYRQYHARGFDVLAINVDERQRDADAFLQQRPHQMPVFFDPKGDAPTAFQIQGMPSSVLIDRAGNIRFAHMGYSDKVVDDYQQEIHALLAER
jgi:cytochrome c biogenesis protein CcmG/thiol:disulfide interchange protein DsbE